MSINQNTIDRLIEDLIERTLKSPIEPTLLKDTCQTLSDAGLSILRVNMSWTTLHPTIGALTLKWWRNRDYDDITRYAHADGETDEWLKSPGYHMVTNEIERLNIRLDGEKPDPYFPIFDELISEGATHYILRLFSFSKPGPHTYENDGMILSFASDRKGGFNEEEIQTLARVEPYIALALKMALRERIAQNTLSAYLGENAASRVLSGSIKLGDGENIPAVIWYSDLRKSTDLGDSLPGPELLTTLNEYFSCTAGAVMDHGGEVLRFVGDAVLAIFPSDGRSLKETCDKATMAARDALTRMEAVNKSRKAQHKEPLAFGLGLHTGEVMFGNIGIPERLDFSVTGPAANETARIESMTKELASPILASVDFAKNSTARWDSLGSYPLKGVKRTIELFSLN
ncbi:MAG: adenylate/guanylate cyclase domain-containing protein [Methylocystaceae bacterium]|nr:adenylate/guanylate cyclase domain-containing protein [Methylocystaceae bacterium]